jgi:hypothetical protein
MHSPPDYAPKAALAHPNPNAVVHVAFSHALAAAGEQSPRKMVH